jgi:predicted transcriptional regulator
MTIKEKVIRAVKELPDDASIEDAMERFLFIVKIEKGIQEANSGKTLLHQHVKEKMSKWLH